MAQIERQYRFINANTASTWEQTAEHRYAPNSGTDGTAQLVFLPGQSLYRQRTFDAQRKVDGTTRAIELA